MRKMPLFYKILLPILAAILLVFAILLIILWSSLAKYQAGLPIHKMDMIISEIKEGDLVDFYDKYDFYVADFEEKENIISYLKESFEGEKKLSYKKIYSRDDTRYAVLNGDKSVFTAVLVKEEGEYNVDHILLNTEISVQIDIPKGFSLYIDNKKAEEKWIVERHTEENIDFPFLFVMENKEKEIDTYLISGLLKEVEVSVKDYEEDDVPLVLNDKLEIDYMVYDISIPVGLKLLANGKEVDKKYIVKEETHPEFILLQISTYRLEGVLGNLSVKVYNNSNGEELEIEEEDNTISLKKIKYTIDLPSGSNLYIEGDKIDPSRIKEKDLLVDSLSQIPDKYVDKPTYDRYIFDFLGWVPEIRVESSTGLELKVDKGPSYARAEFNISEDEASPYLELIQERSFMYSKYVTNDLSLGNFMKVVRTDTPIYEVFRDLQPYFYTNHIGYEFKDVKVGNIQKYADNAISGDISYVQYIYKSEKEIFTFPSDFTFFLVEYQGEWYIMDFIVRET